ncbi:MAG TPA: Clp protease N-terminal domain-containing protein, partial [Candidatus Saccharimonadales bacterium]|nr:Clp protease N-terminal domain-containing protein [Candidatus Saccharimonadales bacterium]
MQFDRFTIKTQEALQGAQSVAQRNSNQEIDGEHLMLALLEQPDGLIQPVLQKLGVSLQAFQADIESEISRRAKVQGSTTSDTFL